MKFRIFSNFKVTSKKANISKVLTPLNPTSILCIGLNYKRHAEEGNLPIPEYPVLFMKQPNSIQNHNDPIIIPKVLESKSVDISMRV